MPPPLRFAIFMAISLQASAVFHNSRTEKPAMGEPYDVAVDGPLMYICYKAGGYVVWEPVPGYSPPVDYQVVYDGTALAVPKCENIQVVGSFLYILGEGKITEVDVTTATSPVIGPTAAVCNTATQFTMNNGGEYGYISCGTGGVQAIDFSSMTVKSTLPVTASGRSVTSIAFHKGLGRLLVSEAATPPLFGSITAYNMVSPFTFSLEQTLVQQPSSADWQPSAVALDGDRYAVCMEGPGPKTNTFLGSIDSSSGANFLPLPMGHAQSYDGRGAVAMSYWGQYLIFSYYFYTTFEWWTNIIDTVGTNHVTLDHQITEPARGGVVTLTNIMAMPRRSKGIAFYYVGRNVNTMSPPVFSDTLAPPTPAPSTPAPLTTAPATQSPSTTAPDTPFPDTPAPITQAPNTPFPDTPAPDTLVPDTLSPSTPSPDTSVPDTQPPVTQVPTTTAPGTQQPASSGTTLEPTEGNVTQPPESTAPATMVPVPVVVEESDDNNGRPKSFMHNRAISTVTAVAGLSSAIAGTGSSANIAGRILVVSLACTVDKEAPFMLHPTQMKVAGSEAAGMVIGNFAITVGFGAVCYVLVRLAANGGEKLFPQMFEGLDTQGWMRFPSAPLFVFQLFYQGSTLGGARLIVRWESPMLVALGIVCIVGHIAIPLWLLAIIKRDIPAKAIYKYDDRSYSPPMQLLVGRGEWVSMYRGTHWVQRFSSVMRLYRQEVAWFGIVEFTSSLVISATQALEPRSFVGCGNIKVASSGVFLLLLAAEFVIRPHAKIRESTFDTVILLLETAGVVVMAVGYYKEDINSVEFDVASGLLLAATLVLCTHLLLNMISEILILITKRRKRLQEEVWGPLAKKDVELIPPALKKVDTVSTGYTPASSPLFTPLMPVLSAPSPDSSPPIVVKSKSQSLVAATSGSMRTRSGTILHAPSIIEREGSNPPDCSVMSPLKRPAASKSPSPPDPCSLTASTRRLRPKAFTLMANGKNFEDSSPVLAPLSPVVPTTERPRVGAGVLSPTDSMAGTGGAWSMAAPLSPAGMTLGVLSPTEFMTGKAPLSPVGMTLVGNGGDGGVTPLQSGVSPMMLVGNGVVSPLAAPMSPAGMTLVGDGGGVTPLQSLLVGKRGESPLAAPLSPAGMTLVGKGGVSPLAAPLSPHDEGDKRARAGTFLRSPFMVPKKRTRTSTVLSSYHKRISSAPQGPQATPMAPSMPCPPHHDAATMDGFTLL